MEKTHSSTHAYWHSTIFFYHGQWIMPCATKVCTYAPFHTDAEFELLVSSIIVTSFFSLPESVHTVLIPVSYFSFVHFNNCTLSRKTCITNQHIRQEKKGKDKQEPSVMWPLMISPLACTHEHIYPVLDSRLLPTYTGPMFEYYTVYILSCPHTRVKK